MGARARENPAPSMTQLLKGAVHEGDADEKVDFRTGTGRGDEKDNSDGSRANGIPLNDLTQEVSKTFGSSRGNLLPSPANMTKSRSFCDMDRLAKRVLRKPGEPPFFNHDFHLNMQCTESRALKLIEVEGTNEVGEKPRTARANSQLRKDWKSGHGTKYRQDGRVFSGTHMYMKNGDSEAIVRKDRENSAILSGPTRAYARAHNGNDSCTFRLVADGSLYALPEFWRECKDGRDQTYYFNVKTEQRLTLKERPTDKSCWENHQVGVAVFVGHRQYKIMYKPYARTITSEILGSRNVICLASNLPEYKQGSPVTIRLGKDRSVTFEIQGQVYEFPAYGGKAEFLLKCTGSEQAVKLAKRGMKGEEEARLHLCKYYSRVPGKLSHGINDALFDEAHAPHPYSMSIVRNDKNGTVYSGESRSGKKTIPTFQQPNGVFFEALMFEDFQKIQIIPEESTTEATNQRVDGGMKKHSLKKNRRRLQGLKHARDAFEWRLRRRL